MRATELYFPTLREVPAEAELESHRLLLRGGFIRRLAAGVYSFLPLGLRVLRKVEEIIRQEMNATGAQEVLLPNLHPAELWQRTNRWDNFGPELIKLTDRNDRQFCLSPTHEEAVTSLVAGELRSYRELPVNLYQIQTKFRDEPRPRGGLIRAREFIMKDAYSFDADDSGLDRSYQAMYQAYCRIFERCGLPVKMVEAEAGAMGGSDTREFVLIAEAGEDLLLLCPGGDYSASQEAAEHGQPQAAASAVQAPAPRPVDTPGKKTVQQVTELLGMTADRLMKTLLYLADGKVVAALVRGDRELSEPKLARALGASSLAMADEQTVQRATGSPVGFAGPVGLAGVQIVADPELAGGGPYVTGANQADAHLVDVVPGRDFQVGQWAQLRQTVGGDPCPRCGQPMEQSSGIELGHLFKLHTIYSRALGATFADEAGHEHPMEMGCYGIGVTRMIAAVAEHHRDSQGLIWPESLAPFRALVLVINSRDQAQGELGERAYQALRQAGVEVLLDDRDERPGVKFKDADLIGIPWQVLAGKRAPEGLLELRRRGAEGSEFLTVEQVVERLSRGDPADCPCG